MKSKKCKKCDVEKSIEEFGKQSSRKDGRVSFCKNCVKEKYKNTVSIYLKKTKNKSAESRKRWRDKNIDIVRAKDRERYKKEKEKRKLYHKEYYKENKEEISSKAKIYWNNNKDKISKKHNEYHKNRMKTDPKYKLDMYASYVLRDAITGRRLRTKWKTYFNYTIKELKDHLESKFKDGMTWENYGLKGWVVDHTIAKKYFIYESVDNKSFTACWALSNLQPLWYRENLEKRDKLEMTQEVKEFLESVNHV